MLTHGRSAGLRVSRAWKPLLAPVHCRYLSCAILIGQIGCDGSTLNHDSLVGHIISWQLSAGNGPMPGLSEPNSTQGREESGRLSTVEALRVLEDPTDLKLKALTQLARVAFGGSSLSGGFTCSARAQAKPSNTCRASSCDQIIHRHDDIDGQSLACRPLGGSSARDVLVAGRVV